MEKGDEKKEMKGGEEKMAPELRQVMRNEFFEICPKCKKEIRGSSSKSASHNLKIHLLSCPSKINK